LIEDPLPAPAGTAPVQSSEVALADHLQVGYQKHTVWSDANFHIRRGEFVAVIGPNGAGKTTLFRLLLGLLRPERGNLEIFGAPPRRGNPKIGYVPQSHTVDRDTNVEASQLVRLGYVGNRWIPDLTPRLFREERTAVHAALESVGATELGKKALGELSGGELQRIFLAEALVGNPELLLLDEPLASLDIRRAEGLVRLVNHLVRTRNVATLLVAHDINPLIHYLDRVIYIANGRVATGTPQEVLTTQSLTALYGVRVEVLHDSRGNMVISGGEDSHPDEAT
jgi:zinc/manganese transport system ATP-binding protein